MAIWWVECDALSMSLVGHVDVKLTRTTVLYLNIASDQWTPTAVFPGGLFYQDNTPYHTAHIV